MQATMRAVRAMRMSMTKLSARSTEGCAHVGALGFLGAGEEESGLRKASGHAHDADLVLSDSVQDLEGLLKLERRQERDAVHGTVDDIAGFFISDGTAQVSDEIVASELHVAGKAKRTVVVL